MGINNLSLDLLEKYDVQGPRYTSYPPAPFWKTGKESKDYAEILKKSNRGSPPPPLSLYLHLPFCEKLCLFCACTAIITGRNHRYEEPYLDSLEKEIQWVAQWLDSSRPVVQVHLGGGTPNYFSPENLNRLMNGLKSHFSFDANVEMSVEINPRTVTIDHIEILREIGFTRFSLGIQDFNPAIQKKIRRVQPFEIVEHLVQKARKIGVTSINFDLVYGLPGQTIESFIKTIEQVLLLNPDRLAVYSYAYVPWMKKYQEKINQNQLQGRQKMELFVAALNILTRSGYEYVGMDHFAKKNDELAKARDSGTLWRNFQGYTTKAGTDLIGFGVSAISQVADGFMQNDRQLYAYQAAVRKGGTAVVRGHICSKDDLIRYRAIQSLMCQAKLTKSAIETEFGIEFDQYFSEEMTKFKDLEKDGLVEITKREITPTSTGRMFLRNLAMVFDAYLPKPGEKKVFSRTF